MLILESIESSVMFNKILAMLIAIDGKEIWLEPELSRTANKQPQRQDERLWRTVAHYTVLKMKKHIDWYMTDIIEMIIGTPS